jgi:hypothetical protein
LIEIHNKEDKRSKFHNQLWSMFKFGIFLCWKLSY